MSGVTIGKELRDEVAAVVYKGIYRSRRVAVKIFNDRTDDLTKEKIESLKTLNHENVVLFLHHFTDYYSRSNLIIEFTEGGSLQEALSRKKFSIEAKRSIIFQISSGVAYLHDEGIVHRNLNPHNVLFKDRSFTKLVVANFEITEELTEEMASSLYRPDEHPLTMKSDVYSLSCVACCVLLNKPSSVIHLSQLVSGVREGNFLSGRVIWSQMIFSALSEDQQYRPTAVVFRDGFTSLNDMAAYW